MQSRLNELTVVTCALTGGGPIGGNPAVPITPEQIANAAIEAAQAGAAIAHIHVRDPATGEPSMAIELFRETVERIRASGSDLILNLTTGYGATLSPDPSDIRRAGPGSNLYGPDERIAHILELRPEICTLDLATINLGEDSVFMNLPSHLRRMAGLALDAGVKPEIEIFDAGNVALLRRFVADGTLPEDVMVQLCLGVGIAGLDSDVETLLHLRARLPERAAWAGFGVGRHEFPVLAQVHLLGGHVRVGLEDNHYIAPGVKARSNAELVEKAVRIVRAHDGDVATPAEARVILGLAGQPASSARPGPG